MSCYVLGLYLQKYTIQSTSTSSTLQLVCHKTLTKQNDSMTTASLREIIHSLVLEHVRYRHFNSGNFFSLKNMMKTTCMLIKTVYLYFLFACRLIHKIYSIQTQLTLPSWHTNNTLTDHINFGISLSLSMSRTRSTFLCGWGASRAPSKYGPKSFLASRSPHWPLKKRLGWWSSTVKGWPRWRWCW